LTAWVVSSKLGGVCREDDGYLTIRPAAPGDVLCLTELCEQLGYPTSQNDVRRRLTSIGEDDAPAMVYVAQLPGGEVVGWVHVYRCVGLLVPPYAEIGGLVVDQAHRGRGIGRRLMEEAEAWARQNDCQQVRLRSNVARVEAHRFYEQIGYQVAKSQMVYWKALL
jgi:GNAT superfamily N-acetyltransferase